MPQSVLVTGGAGYIGSHVVHALHDRGIRHVVLDNFSTGSPRLLPDGTEIVEGDVGDAACVADILKCYQIDAVIHFAGSIVAPESVEQPIAYYQNNTANSLTLMDECVKAGVNGLIFSSSAAVYGVPDTLPVDETSPTAPISPYGHSKRMTEQMLQDVSYATSLKSICLRYFNVAGADPEGRTGQIAENTTHLIRVAIQTALGRRDALSIFGTDYDTEDGTGVRDFIHVSDLADAHVAALLALDGNAIQSFEIINCGYGKGYSVLEVVRALEKVTGNPLPVNHAPRREGDIPAMIADNQKILKLLDWTPQYPSLEGMLRTGLAWEETVIAKQIRPGK